LRPLIHFENMQSRILYALAVHILKETRAQVIDDHADSPHLFSTMRPLTGIMVLVMPSHLF
jgi:hypothetical protein